MMHDFKVGDIVVRTRNSHNGMLPGYSDTIIDLPLNGSVTLANYGLGHSIYSLIIRTPTDEPLPPVPDNTLYINAANWGIQLYATGSDLLISTGNPNNLKSGWVGATICPDIALQVAHDLTRMAMELKRKQEK